MKRSPKEKLRIPRQSMPTQDPNRRVENFEEVSLGLPVQLAQQEAQRCLQCAKSPCTSGCPLGVKVKEFIELACQGDYLAAAAKIREDNVLPAITGRVCPQEDQCEGACVLGKRFDPVAIGYLERFVADFERRVGQVALPERSPPTGKRVAVVGSGPAGLSVAGDLVQRGHDVTVFEALHELGGVLVYGIPEFRLPKNIVREEIDNLRQMGVEFQVDIVIGKTMTVDELLSDEAYDAVFVGTGAGLPRFLDIPGEHLNGVYSANEFLTRVNLMKAYLFPEYDEPICDCRGKRVVVVGGGNTALDAVRCARRLGALHASILYRRSEAEMPAREEEIQHAKEEGIDLLTLASPVEFLGDSDGGVRAARCVRLRLGDLDASQRPRPVEIPGSGFDLPTDVVVVAIGTDVNPLIQGTSSEITTDKKGRIQVDPDTKKTQKEGVFAGGDVATGTATVISAMAAGRKAAQSIDEYLTSGVW